MTPNTTASLEASRLDVSKLTYSYTTTPRDVPSEAAIRDSDDTICTDHMIVASCTAKKGWVAPELKPFGPFSLLSPLRSRMLQGPQSLLRLRRQGAPLPIQPERSPSADVRRAHRSTDRER